jgi:hypothetical protein
MSEEKPTAAPGTNGTRLAKLSSPWFIWPATVALAVLLFFGLGYFFDVLTHESTDDAFIAAHVVSIAPRIAGQVAAVHVLDNEDGPFQRIAGGDRPGGLLDDRRAKAIRRRCAGGQLQNGAGRTRFDGRESGHRPGHCRPVEGRRRSGAATDERAQADFQRNQELRKQNTISRRNLTPRRLR